jgi:imidazolonepropionase-like amidohydrolase
LIEGWGIEMKKLMVVLLCAFPMLVAGQEEGKLARADHFIIDHVNLIDGIGNGVLPDMAVEIKGGKIIAVGKSAPRDDSGVMVISLKDYYLIPGLIDAHVHYSSGSMESDIGQLRMLLYGGITTVRDMAGDGRRLAELKRDAAVGDIEAPDIYFSALMAGPTFFEDPRVQDASQGAPVGNTAWARAITEKTDFRQVVAEARGIGATGLKIYADLPADLIQKLAEEAHRQGLKVWSHATVFPARPSECVEAGVDVISHSALLYFETVKDVPDSYKGRYDHGFEYDFADTSMFDSLFAKMVARGTILDATVLIYTLEGVGGDKTDKQKMADFCTRITKLAHEHGVKISAGTDLGMEGRKIPPLHDELAILVGKCGFTPMEAIKSATFIAAQTMGIESETGTIEAGKDADLVVLAKNPLDDIKSTTAIILVVKNGKIFVRQ